MAFDTDATALATGLMGGADRRHGTVRASPELEHPSPNVAKSGGETPRGHVLGDMKIWVAGLSIVASSCCASLALAQNAGVSPATAASARYGDDDLNADGRVTLAETRAAAQALLARLDADGDGQVTLVEVNERARRWRVERGVSRFQVLDHDRDGYLSPFELGPRRRFVHLDRDHDGRLTPTELGREGAPRRCAGGEEAALRSSLWRRDLDRDGRVTHHELLRAAERRFARRDRNHDGVLSRDELGSGWR